MLLNFLVLLVFGLTMGSFAWGMVFYFKVEEKKTREMHLVTFGGSAIGVVNFYYLLYFLDFMPDLSGMDILHLSNTSGQVQHWRKVVALSFYGLSLLLFWSAISASRKANLTFVYSIDLPQEIIKTGPYQFIRHPFYTSYTIAFSVLAILFPSFVLALCSLFMLALYVKGALQEQAKFASSNLSAQYTDYIAKTGMFLPRIF